MSSLASILKVIEPHPRSNFKDKAIAVGLALLVWVAVNAEEAVPQIFDPVVVELQNQPPDLAIAGDWQQTVSVRVRGSERDLERLTAGRLSPRLDLSGAIAGVNRFPIRDEDLNAPSGIEIDSVDPREISILLEELVEKEVPVSAVTGGEPAPGYQVVGRRTEPPLATVRGPRSAIEAVDQVSTDPVDVRGRTESVVRRVPLHLDAPFITIAGQPDVEVQVDIAEEAEDIEFDAVPVEVVNARYQVAVNPDRLRVLLRGPPSLLARIDPETLRLVIDAAELAPRTQDYRMAPTIDYGIEGLDDMIELVATFPQREIDVHVFQQPARQ